MSQLEQTLFTVAALLDKRGDEYAVMGGLAVRMHSIPRPTYDVDLIIAVEREDLPSLFDSLEKLGHTIPESYRRGWVDQVAGMPLVKVRTYISADKGIDVDFFLAETEFQKSLIQRRMKVEIEEGTKQLWVVTPEDLLLLKLLASRRRDLIDVGDILFMQGQLDEAYMRLWAERLEISDRLEAALAER